MRARVSFTLVALPLCTSLALAACSSDSTPSGASAVDSGTTNPDSGKATTPSDGGNEATTSDSGNETTDGGNETTTSDSGTQLTLTRVAHLSPGAPNVDFCLVPHGSAGGFGPVPGDGGTVPIAPIFGSIGLAAGIGYGQVSTYDPGGAPIGSYDFRVVAAGTTDCSKPGVADFPSVNLPAGHVTIAATGLLGAGAVPAFGLTIFSDDSSAPASSAALRFVHASPGTPAVNVGVLSSSGLTTIFSDVAYGHVAAATDGGIDTNGYAALAPVAAPGVTIAAAVHDADAASPPAISVPNVTLTAGETATAFAIGELTGTVDAGTALGVLMCNDNPSDAGFAFINPSCAIAHP